MPFFQGAYNFAINNANMNDVQGNFYQNTTNIEGGNYLNLSYDAPYHPVDPYALSLQESLVSRLEHLHNVEDIQDPDIASGWPFNDPAISGQPQNSSSAPAPSAGIDESEVEKPDAEGLNVQDPLLQRTWWSVAHLLLNQVYLHLLLRLPSLYRTRFDQIVIDAGLSLKEMKDMALRVLVADHKAIRFLRILREGQKLDNPQILPPVYQRTKERWESFVDELLEEWRTLNLVSALLVPGILTMFQIAGAAPDDPVTRYLVFWSLLSALVSLLYGCMFVVQFSRMRNVHKMLEWTLVVQDQSIFWNVPVMLAMPLVWLTWSIVVFVISIMWFMWRATAPLPDGFVFVASPKTAIGFRVFLCATLGIGITYGILIFITFQHHGKEMDEKWKERVDRLVQQVLQQHRPQNINQRPPMPPLASTQATLYNSTPQMPHAGGSDLTGLQVPGSVLQGDTQRHSRRSRHSRTPSPNSAISGQNQFPPGH